MKTIVISLAKKYAVKSINELLSKYKDNVGIICERINYWTVRLGLIIEYLKKISARCSDGQLDSKEVDDSLDEIETLIKQF